jgi:hypothetical protein
VIGSAGPICTPVFEQLKKAGHQAAHPKMASLIIEEAAQGPVILQKRAAPVFGEFCAGK